MSDTKDSGIGGIVVVGGLALLALVLLGAFSGGGNTPKQATADPEPEPMPPPLPSPAPEPVPAEDTSEPEQQYCDRCEIWYTESSCPGYYCSSAYQDWLDDDADGSGDGSG